VYCFVAEYGSCYCWLANGIQAGNKSGVIGGLLALLPIIWAIFAAFFTYNFTSVD